MAVRQYKRPDATDEYTTLFYEAADYFMLDINEGVAKDAGNNAIDVFFKGTLMMQMPEAIPLKITFHSGAYKKYKKGEQPQDVEPSPVELYICEQLKTIGFDKGFKGVLAHNLKVETYTDLPPISNLELLDKVGLPAFPEKREFKKGGNFGGGKPETLEEKMKFKCQAFNDNLISLITSMEGVCTQEPVIILLDEIEKHPELALANFYRISLLLPAENSSIVDQFMETLLKAYS